MASTSSLRCLARLSLKPSSSKAIPSQFTRTFATTISHQRPARKTTLFTSGPTSRRQQCAPPYLCPSTSRSMFIQTEATPNDDSLKFMTGCSVMEDGTAEFMDTKSAFASPLAVRLMGLEGVSGVLYGPDFVTVSKDPEQQWALIQPDIYALLTDHFASGRPLFRSAEDRERAGPQDTRILDTDSETVALVKELLETRVRPAIMEDGGDIEYRGFDADGTGIVRVKLKGSCRGCSSSTVTLKSGIERMLMHYIPEVKGVEHVLDPEEEISLSEFEKLEKKLGHGVL